MGIIALPKIELNGKQYFIDARLQEIRSAVYPPKSIEFINFNDLPKKDFDKVLNVLYPTKKGER